MRTRNIKIWLWTIIISVISFVSYAAKPTDTYHAAQTTGYQLRYPNQVKQLLTQINPEEMWNNLTKLTSFPDRSADSQSGVEAALWIKKQLDELVRESGRHDVNVFTIETKGLEWGQTPYASNQPSVILQIGDSSNPAVVVGAHLDTISPYGEGNIEGANDNGSGTVAVLEVARTVLTSGMRFNKPIYLIFYAGEEQGLWGSQAVIADFQKRHIAVSALMQLDQIGYARNNELTMYLASDKNLSPGKHTHTDQGLTLFTKSLVEQYVKRPVELSCQGGSDEEAWTDITKVKAVRPLEADYCDSSHMYQDFHSTRDTLDKLSLTHMTDYLKLAISFIVEMAEPI